ncbi:triple tyrosine motif-containing protein [Massilia sp. YIM B02763]|uniref:sensor histidine kinase n=1 Tax=Massilia sp. YIM B02763 TaxID=3050130 RepID=UPI0025B6B12C|nr:sensor histidine kinase [Massilia sp. YIM B02763]MDN4053279.1 triple tyrosine motif-containing protein [Massilia sp. YIM B02763]
MTSSLSLLRQALRALGGLLAAAAMHTAAAGPDLSHYQHTRWTQENGGPPQANAMAQTSDGWLWLNTIDGLYRFDGQRFERRPLPGVAGPKRIFNIGVHGRDVYIMYLGRGMAVLHPDGRLEDLAHGPGSPERGIVSMTVDPDGSLWTGSAAGIHHLAHGRWTHVLDSAEWRTTELSSMLRDGAGGIWAANAYGAWHLDRARGRFDKVSERGGSVTLAPDGGVWLTADRGGPIERLAAPAAMARTDAVSYSAGVFDAGGTFWSLQCPERLCLVPPTAGRAEIVPRRDAAARLAPAFPLSGSEAILAMRDREGDIWIATEAGLDRFREKRVLATGLAGSGDRYTLAADDTGQVWAAEKGTGTLWRLVPGRPPEAQAGVWANVIARAPDGALLLAGKRSIQRRSRAGIEEIALPPGRDGKPVDIHSIGILDDGRILWVMSPEIGLVGWNGKAWLPRSAFTLPREIYLAVREGGGRLWLATSEGKLVRYQDDRLTSYDMSMLGMGSGIFPGEQLVAGGDQGLAVLKDGRLRLLRAHDPGVLRNVSGLAVDADGDRWLNGAAGLVRVRAADWRRTMADPDTPLRYELFDALDGYPGQSMLGTRLGTAFTGDGRHLWFVASGGVITVDTARLRRNTVAPQPLILDLATDQQRFDAAAPLRLPPGSNAFRIRYTAPALRAPERLHFQYRLDGVDARWQDAGTRRMTAYTNVAPGDYVFRVRAVNEDGVASAQDATLRLTVEPTLAQSLPFRIACAFLLAALAYALHRYRVRQLTRRLTERLQVRNDERERIARTLHDTILQAVQVLMLRLDGLAASLPAGDRARDELRRALGDAAGAIDAGRDQVRELRGGAPRLEDAIEDCAGALRGIHPGVAFALRVEGRARRLHDAVADEAAHIVCEALRNAFAHAGARRIEVVLDYGRRGLDARVRDDGGGLDAEVARAGYRSGHWGLIGMRERAGRIGARLALDSRPGGGTAVTLAVPAARAYART